MAKPFGKLPGNFLILKGKEDFIQALEHHCLDVSNGLVKALGVGCCKIHIGAKPKILAGAPPGHGRGQGPAVFTEKREANWRASFFGRSTIERTHSGM